MEKAGRGRRQFEITMKIPLLLCVLFLGAPLRAQTPAPAPDVKALETAAAAPQRWQFTPDFLRDQNQISWRIAPEFEDALLVTTTTNTGVTTGETVNFPDENGVTLAVLTATFDKKGQLQKQQLRDKQGKVLQTQTGFDAIVPLSVPGSIVGLATSVTGGTLKRRFAIGYRNLPIVLVAQSDERGRRTHDDFGPLSAGQNQTVDYIYSARGPEKITVSGDNAATLLFDRDDTGKTRAVRATQNAVLTRFSAPIRDEKGDISGTRTETYRGGILSEATEDYLEGIRAPDPNRPREKFTERTLNENGAPVTERKYEWSADIGGPKTARETRARLTKHTVYAGAKPVSEEMARDGVLTQRIEFNGNGLITKLTTFKADGSVESVLDFAKASSFADGGVIRKTPATP